MPRAAMRILLVAVVLGSLASCADDGVRHTPDAIPGGDAAVVDAPVDAALAPALLSGSPGATAFGDVVLGQATAKVTYTISNDGEQTSGTIGVLLDSTTSGFAISDNHCSGVALAPHETCTFAVSFQPAVAGLAMTTVHAGASPGGDVARDLTGTGLQPGAIDIIEASHNYLSLAVDAQPATHTFVVKNTGQVPTGVPAPAITGTVSSFSIASTTCTAALAPMATCSVVVRFDPPTVGMKPGSLVVTASPGGSDSATLAGTGFAHVAVPKGGTGGGGTVTSNVTGIDCGSSCAADFTTTPVVLTAVPTTGSTFAGWTGDCSGTVTCSLDLTAGKAVTATFNVQMFTLTTATTGTGSGTVTGAGTYPYNTPVTVTASPASDSTFTGFSGACTGMGPCTVTMTQARSVTAGFDLIPETLTVTTAAPGGTITSAPAGISCTAATCAHDFGYGKQVVLTATPDPGYKLAVWAGDCSGTPLTSACTVTMDQARSVTVRFAPQSYTFTLSILGDYPGTVTVNGTAYTANTSFAVSYGQTLNMTASTNGLFWTWGGACASQGNNPSCSLTVDGDTNVSATFHNTTYRYILKAITQTPNGFSFQVTYPPNATSSAECTSAQPPGQSCFGSLPAGTVVMLKAHLPPVTAFQPVWNNLPTWTGCDSVSADQLTCTIQLFSPPTITVTGDVRAGP